MVSLSFMYPKFLFLLFLIPVFIFIYFFSAFYNKKKAMIFPNFEAMERISDIEFFSKGFLSLYLGLGILLCLVFAISGTTVTFNASTSQYSYIIAVDNSGSMKTTDILPTRLDAAKEFAKRFVDMLPIGAEVGVLSFSGDVNSILDLDTSKIKVDNSIDSIIPSDIGGTNIYNAIIIANKMFGSKAFKALILISDGQINIGDLQDVSNYAVKNNIIVNTFAVGTSSGVTDVGTISSVDEEFLKALAFQTKGQFFRVQSAGDFAGSFGNLLTISNQEVSLDISLYLLFAAVTLFLIDWVFANFRFGSLP